MDNMKLSLSTGLNGDIYIILFFIFSIFESFPVASWNNNITEILGRHFYEILF